MTPATLAIVLRHSAFAGMLLGLCASEFAGLHRLGIILALAGIAALGGWIVAAYLAWEHGA